MRWCSICLFQLYWVLYSLGYWLIVLPVTLHFDVPCSWPWPLRFLGLLRLHCTVPAPTVFHSYPACPPRPAKARSGKPTPTATSTPIPTQNPRIWLLWASAVSPWPAWRCTSQAQVGNMACRPLPLSSLHQVHYSSPSSSSQPAAQPLSDCLRGWEVGWDERTAF